MSNVEKADQHRLLKDSLAEEECENYRKQWEEAKNHTCKTGCEAACKYTCQISKQ